MRLTTRLRVVARVTHCLKIVPRQREVGVVIDANDMVNDRTSAAAFNTHGVGSNEHSAQFTPRRRLVKRGVRRAASFVEPRTREPRALFALR